MRFLRRTFFSTRILLACRHGIGADGRQHAGHLAPDGRRRREDGARAQRRLGRRSARSADQRHARRRGGRRVQAGVQLERPAQQSAAAAGELPDSDGDAHRRDDVERRGQPAAAAVRHVVQRVVERLAHRQQQLPEQLQPAAPVRPGAQPARSRSSAICPSISARQQLATSRINRDIADTRLRESLVHTTANVKSAYWNLVAGERQRRLAEVGARARRRSSRA